MFRAGRTTPLTCSGGAAVAFGTTMATDRYRSFADLAAQEVEHVDYRICAVARREDVLIVAPHGGHIEPSTSAVARAIAADDLSLYLFEGLKPERAHADLHITSARLDEPQAIALATSAHRIVTVHGRSWRGDSRAVWLGGLDGDAREAIAVSLDRAGFAVRNPGDGLFALDPMNICNRGLTGKGVQLELPRRLRDSMVADAAHMTRFAEAIRAVILAS